MLSIGEFALASGLTAKALRLYDELELLTPAEVDRNNGYRYYAPEQVEQPRLVARLRSAEVPLVRIAAILRASTPEAAADEVLSYWREVEGDRTSGREVITSLVALLRAQDSPMKPPETSDIDLADAIALLDDGLTGADDLARISEAQRRAQALTDLATASSTTSSAKPSSVVRRGPRSQTPSDRPVSTAGRAPPTRSTDSPA